MEFADLPLHFKLQYSKADIDRAVSQMGAKITEWAKDEWKRSHADIMTIPVLRGGIFFFADLVRQIGHSVEIAPVRTRGYEESQIGVLSGHLNMYLEGVGAEGRSVLLVDDICDSGRTLSELTVALKSSGAREVRSAVLIRRILDKKTFKPDYVGFDYHGAEWFVGYGMEDCGRFRNLSNTYIIQQK